MSLLEFKFFIEYDSFDKLKEENYMKNLLKKLITTIIFFVIAYVLIDLTPYYIETVKYAEDEIRFVIDDNEQTKTLPDPIIIKDENVMLSMDTIKKFFDKYIYFDEKYEAVIIAYDTYVVKMFVDDKDIIINDEPKHIDVPVMMSGEDIYIPIQVLEEVYDIDVVVNEKVIVTTSNVEYFEVELKKDAKLKKYKKKFSLTKSTPEKGETLRIYTEDFGYLADDQYVWARSENGDFGYIRKGKIKFDDTKAIAVFKEEETKKEKINLIWEYATNYSPDRSAEAKKDCVDVLSPTWIYSKNSEGELKHSIDSNYLSWANRVGYKVWPTIKNDDIKIDGTSVLLNDMYYRKAFIDNIVELCKKYNFDGINLDFENMYKEDKEEFAELVRELSATLRLNGIISTVDVNVPDGSPTWSLCYDTKAISDAANYVMLMAYDQYGQSSSTAGPVASLAWVEANLKKLIDREKVDSEKLVLGVPFYSRFWRTKNGVVKSTSSLGMAKAKEYVKNNPNSSEWNEIAGQYIVEYKSGADTILVYVEDEKALKEKLELIDEYNLAGFAAWRRGYEVEEVWNVIAEEIN